MLVKILFSSIPRYPISLYSPPVKKYFAKNFKLARDSVSSLAKKYNVTDMQCRKYFAFYPRAFQPDSQQNKMLEKNVEVIQQLAQQPGVKGITGQVLKDLLFKSDKLGFELSIKGVESIVKTVQELALTENQIRAIFGMAPNLLNEKFAVIIQEKMNMLQLYLGLNKTQIIDIFTASPFLVPGSTRAIQGSIRVLFNGYALSKPEIVSLMKTMGEIFLLGDKNLEDIYKTPRKWGLSPQETKELFLAHPLLFFNYPYDVMPLKRKILKYLNFTAEMGEAILRRHPSILIWSVGSLQAKAVFIKNRMKLDLDINSIELLDFNFNRTLRPRGELLIRSKFEFENSNVVSMMKMSDEQFVKAIGTNIEKLTDEKAKFPISNELDFRRKKAFEHANTNQKIIDLAKAYRRD